LDEKILEVEKFPKETQQEIYSKFHGPIHFDMEVERNFSMIKPWVEKWIGVQV
jgi:hypothetical protein